MLFLLTLHNDIATFSTKFLKLNIFISKIIITQWTTHQTLRVLHYMCFISDSDDDFESPSKLFWTSDIKQASTSSSYNPIQQPEVLQDQSLHGPCSAQLASFEYKVEADLVESEQLSCILKDKEKEIELVRAQKMNLEKETRQVCKCLICNITATLPLAISPCCKIFWAVIPVLNAG